MLESMPEAVTAASQPAERTVDSERVAYELLKESLLNRSDGAKIGALGLLFSIIPFFLVLRDQVPLANLGLWLGPMLLFMLWRVALAFRTGPALAENQQKRLRRLDSAFRINSVVMQFWVGTGMWSVAGRSSEIDLFVTLAVCIFGTGAAVSLAHDSRSVAISIPLLFGQCILFWLLKGADGYHISIPLIPVMFLIIAAARRSERNLNESIAIRFENDDLLKQLNEEKESAVTAARKAEEANRAKSVFMAAASHDLRQPLYAISLLSETLGLQQLAPSARDIVEQQGRSLDALRHMFDNLLDLSSFDSGDVQPNIEAVFLPDVLAQLLAEFHPLFESKGLGFEISGIDEHVLTDYDLLSRLLRNLISNAARYTEKGHVSVCAHRDGKVVTIDVIDSGCGIAPEDQERIFQEFVQVNNPERSRDKGVGLGLSIVQRIGDLLDHEVSLTSDPARGTTVRVRLQHVDVATRPRRATPHTTYRPAPIDGDVYVWIVEDDQLVREALHTHLDALSIRHDFATNRADLEQLAADRGWPGFVILDDMLGHDETGLDLARWLDWTVPSGRILIVTGNTEPRRLRELEESGFKLLRKPVSATDLTAWMRSALG